MSIHTPEIILRRISAAEQNSPIAVFHCNRPGHLRAVFADTYSSRQEIQNKESLVGVFHKDMDPAIISKELDDAVAAQENER